MLLVGFGSLADFIVERGQEGGALFVLVDVVGVSIEASTRDGGLNGWGVSQAVENGLFKGAERRHAFFEGQFLAAALWNLREAHIWRTNCEQISHLSLRLSPRQPSNIAFLYYISPNQSTLAHSNHINLSFLIEFFIFLNMLASHLCLRFDTIEHFRFKAFNM